MHWFDWLTDATFVFGGVGVAVAAVLIGAGAWLLPGREKRKLRLPLLLLLAVLALSAARAVLPAHSGLRKPLEVATLFCLLTAVGRSGFVLVVDWFMGKRLNRPMPKIIRDIAQSFVFILVAFATLRAMGADLGSLLTTSALLTAVIGLSLQETLGNVFAGLAIQLQRPFQVGDWIYVDGSHAAPGQVTEINWRSTHLLTNDQVEVIVPNGVIAKSSIANYTQPRPVSRRIVKVQGPYDVPPHVVEAALLEAMQNCTGLVRAPAPAVWLSQYADSGVEYSAVFFIDDFSRVLSIESEVRKRIWYALQRAGVSIPFPVRDVRIHQSSTEERSAAEERRLSELGRMLHRVDFLDVLPDAALRLLAKQCKLQPFTAGEDIIRQGDEGNELFIIQSGEAKVLVAQGDGPILEVARLGPGGVFGEMSLVTGERRTATVRALGTCQVICVGHEAFREVLEAHPDLATRISDVLASRQAEIELVQSSREALDRVTRSGVLLNKIRNFFALWPDDDRD
jgi:small-conductance mechanosensitive channel/CRP-like cAMP-binding protein